MLCSVPCINSTLDTFSGDASPLSVPQDKLKGLAVGGYSVYNVTGLWFQTCPVCNAELRTA